jgi:glycosyltransferase involved in cell wall biosynthesis
VERLFHRKEMKRIGLYLSCPPEAGGAFQYSQSVLAALAALPSDGYELVVAYSHPAWQQKMAGLEGSARSIPVREGLADRLARFLLKEGLPLTAWHIAARFVHPLARRLLAMRCDLWIFPAQDMLSYALPAPTVGVVHDLMHLHEPGFPEVGDKGLRRRRQRHYRNLCRHAVAVLVDSEVGKMHVEAAYGVSMERIRPLPYIAPDYIRNAVSPDFDDRYGLPDKFFFYPAQFWQHKNHDRLVEALASVRERVPDLCLVLAGSEKNALAPLRRKIERLGLQSAVRIVGYVSDDDMPGFYRRARALVMPTFFGPTNIPPLEAMASGCPMALSSIYGMPEQAGEAALWFDPSSVDEMAAQLLRLATDDDLCRRLTEAGLARARAWGPAGFHARLRGIIDDALEATR